MRCFASPPPCKETEGCVVERGQVICVPTVTQRNDNPFAFSFQVKCYVFFQRAGGTRCTTTVATSVSRPVRTRLEGFVTFRFSRCTSHWHRNLLEPNKRRQCWRLGKGLRESVQHPGVCLRARILPQEWPMCACATVSQNSRQPSWGFHSQFSLHLNRSWWFAGDRARGGSCEVDACNLHLVNIDVICQFCYPMISS